MEKGNHVDSFIFMSVIITELLLLLQSYCYCYRIIVIITLLLLLLLLLIYQYLKVSLNPCIKFYRNYDFNVRQIKENYINNIYLIM